MAKTLTRTALISSATNAAGATTRGRLDCSGVDGGMLTLRITNGATGPTVACEGRIMVAHHAAGAMPAAGAEGTGDADWKIVYRFACSTTANDTVRVPWTFGPEVASIQTEFTGNTGQGVIVESLGTTFVY